MKVTYSCPYCGVDFEPVRKDQIYCCSNHRTYASKLRKKQAQQAAAAVQLVQFKKMVVQLRAIAPNAAKRVQELVDTFGLECAESAVKLAVAAYREGDAARTIQHAAT